MFNLVYKYYNNYSAIGLMNLTHEESPWIESLPHTRGTLIVEDSIKSYFDKQILVFLKEIHRKKLSSLKSLRKGWDGYDAPVINPESIDRSFALLDMVNANCLAILNIEPSEEGGVNLFFEKDENSTMGCSVGDSRMSYFIKSYGKTPIFSDFMEYSEQNLVSWKNQVNQFAEDE